MGILNQKYQICVDTLLNLKANIEIDMKKCDDKIHACIQDQADAQKCKNDLQAQWDSLDAAVKKLGG